MKVFLLLILTVFASEKTTENDPKYGEKIGNNEENSIVVKIEEDEYVNVKKKSKYIGVCYFEYRSKWRAQRWSKNENKNVFNGDYDDEETAAHASDNLARKLMEIGEQNHRLNFPYDYIEVYREERTATSKYIGVTYHKNNSKWSARRWSREEKKDVYKGVYDNEKTAAHASDTLARKLMENGKHKHKLNFPDDYTEVCPEEKQTSSKYIGVSYNKINSKWCAQRWSKNENKKFSNGCNYGDDETAAHASDTLARKLMQNSEQKLKLNFPDICIVQNQKKKRKRSADLDVGNPQNN